MSIETAEESLVPVTDRRFRLIWRLTWSLAIAVVVIAALSVGLWAMVKSNHTQRAVEGSCQFYADLSILPITPTSNNALLILIKDARIAYTDIGCAAKQGPLQAPDPRVRRFLPPSYQ